MTNRDKDIHDVTFLESIARNRWVERLPAADLDDAVGMFDRFVDWRTCQAALLNPDPAVRELAIGYLREFATDGDPFSQALLANAPVPPA